jgi:hypothetical protein
MSAEAQSRLSKTNRAHSKNCGYNPQRRESRKQPLTERDGVSLRNEVRDVQAISENRPTTWAHATNAWRSYIEDQRGVEAVFQNESGDLARGSDPHRFAPEYGDKQYAKLKDLERGVQDAYGKRLHTTMLTLTASGQPESEPIPPVDHLDELLDSWSAVTRALNRATDDLRSARLAILEPHPGDGVNNGYLHIHIAIFTDGRVTADDFAPVIDAHLRHCDLATDDAHDLEEDVSIRHSGLDRGDGADDHLDEIAIYLAEYLGTYGDDPLDAPEHVQASNAILWTTGRQRWRPCQTAQSFMAYDAPETDGDWTLIGVEDGDDLIPCDDSTGGVDRFTTGPIGPPPD